MPYVPPGPHLIDPLPTYDELDELVDVDPIRLRDVAMELTKAVKTQQEAIIELIEELQRLRSNVDRLMEG